MSILLSVKLCFEIAKTSPHIAAAHFVWIHSHSNPIMFELQHTVHVFSLLIDIETRLPTGSPLVHHWSPHAKRLELETLPYIKLSWLERLSRTQCGELEYCQRQLGIDHLVSCDAFETQS